MVLRKQAQEETYVVIPALNEASRIPNVIRELEILGFNNIVVVNDGSTDDTSAISDQFPNVRVLDHIVNLGPGASTMTGIEFCISKGANYIATIDADHQNQPADLMSLLERLLERNSDLVIGSRFLQQNDIPFQRLIYNWVGNVVSYIKTGLAVSDSQSGIKIMTRSFAEKLYIDHNGFEFCIDIIKKAKLNSAEVDEAPVAVVYTKETLAKGQNFANGVMMLGKLFNPFSQKV